MAKMTLYHGSLNIIEHPVFGAGNPKNDYGIGFYCTKEIELAKEWACPSPADGFANSYLIDTEGLDILNLSEGHGVLSWLAVLLENRTFDINTPVMRDARRFLLERFLPDYENRDIIIGYRADDSYFSFAKAFLNNTISLEAVAKAMKLGLLGEQICIKSQKAFEKIQYQNSEIADGALYYNKRMQRDGKAREDFRLMQEGTSARDSLFVIDIMRQDWRKEDDIIR